jgi:L-threonine kinase
MEEEAGSRNLLRMTMEGKTAVAKSDQRNHPLWVCGKVGEWAQGINQRGDPIIYSLTLTRSPFQIRTVVERSDTLSVAIHPKFTEDHTKTRKAVLALADAYGFRHDCAYRIVIRGSPPRGKGLGSSSIDIASALLGVRKQRALDLSKTELYKVMCKVERSDYLFEPQSIVAANPLDGSHSFVTRAPECSILAWDTEPLKSVETDTLRHLDQSRRPFEREYRDMFAMIETGDISLILQAATRSAEINNRLLPKAGFDAARKLVKKAGRVGLAAAHTGTWLGFVLPRPIDGSARRLILEFFTGSLRREPTLFETGGRKIWAP